MKIFIYSDASDTEQEPFLSGIYKDEKDFYKVNPDFVIIKSFNAESYLDLLKSQYKNIKSNKTKRQTRSEE